MRVSNCHASMEYFLSCEYRFLTWFYATIVLSLFHASMLLFCHESMLFFLSCEYTCFFHASMYYLVMRVCVKRFMRVWLSLLHASMKVHASMYLVYVMRVWLFSRSCEYLLPCDYAKVILSCEYGYICFYASLSVSVVHASMILPIM